MRIFEDGSGSAAWVPQLLSSRFYLAPPGIFLNPFGSYPRTPRLVTIFFGDYESSIACSD